MTGNEGDSLKHIKKNSTRNRMPISLFLDCIAQMVTEKWQYSTRDEGGISYGHTDCVGVYRQTMYWYYSDNAYKSLNMNKTNVEGQYGSSVYNKPYHGLPGKGKITGDTEFRIGMALFRQSDDKKWEHVAIYVGDYFDGYTNAVIEAVECGDPDNKNIAGYVVIRELEESEEKNGSFTHFGYYKGIDYGR